jgi:DegV family protein with EDD domain
MIAVVTDSTCDIPPEIVERASIYVVPNLITYGQQSFADGIDMTREAFYAWLPGLRRLPRTSGPAPAAFLETYERALQSAGQVISIHAAARLSGICNTAQLAADQLAPGRIHIVDSGQISMGLGWAVLAAAEAAQASAHVEAVLHSVGDTLARVRLLAALNTLDYLARSGRVNMLQAGLGTLLNIKPLIELHEGVVTTIERVRTWSRAVGALADHLRRFPSIERLAVMHTNNAACAAEFLDHVRDVVPPRARTLVTHATTALGVHIGPGALGIAAVIGR